MLFLYILGQIFFYILIVLLVVLAAILFIPFNYYANGSKYGNVSAEGYLSWLFGGLKVKFLYNSETGSSFVIGFMGIHKDMKSSHKEKDEKQKSQEGKEKKVKEKSPYSYLTREIIESAIEALLKLLNHCRPRQLSLNARAGFDDPMYTGLLYGVQGAGFAILDKLNIRIEPTFEEEELTGDLTVGGSIQIFYLLLVAIGFLFAEPFRSILIKNIKIKMKRRMKHGGIRF